MNIGALLISSVTSWQTLLLIVALFGFFPGFTLRILVLGYPKDDPRRQELLGELYALPYWRRPIWVAEQLETVIFDGISPRIQWMLTGRVILRWHLGSGIKWNQKHPETFDIPTEAEKAALTPGTSVKLMFNQSDDWTERMWVRVTKVGRFRIVGDLINEPFGGFPRLCPGSRIKFRSKHIIDITKDDVDPGLAEIALVHRECARLHPLIQPDNDPPGLPPASAA